MLKDTENIIFIKEEKIQKHKDYLELDSMEQRNGKISKKFILTFIWNISEWMNILHTMKNKENWNIIF